MRRRARAPTARAPGGARLDSGRRRRRHATATATPRLSCTPPSTPVATSDAHHRGRPQVQACDRQGSLEVRRRQDQGAPEVRGRGRKESCGPCSVCCDTKAAQTLRRPSRSWTSDREGVRRRGQDVRRQRPTRNRRRSAGGVTCPNFEERPYNLTITGCGDIAACIECVGEAAVDQAIDLYYGDLDQGSGNEVNKCQQAIGKETTSSSRRSRKRSRSAGTSVSRASTQHCRMPASPGQGQGRPAIAKAESRRSRHLQGMRRPRSGVRRHHHRPGMGLHTDRGQRNADDLTPGQIGFASTCRT